MKKVSCILLFIVLSCTNYKTNQKIEKALLVPYNANPKIELLNDVDGLKQKLSKISDDDITLSKPHAGKFRIGIKGNREFSSRMAFEATDKYLLENGYDTWRTLTWFQEFGAYSLTNQGCKNKIGYELYGKEKDIVNEIHIVLNLYTPYNKKVPFTVFSEWISQTLDILSIKLPTNLEKRVLNSNTYYFEDETCFLMLTKDKKIDKNQVADNSGTLDFQKVYRYEIYKFIIKSK